MHPTIRVELFEGRNEKPDFRQSQHLVVGRCAPVQHSGMQAAIRYALSGTLCLLAASHAMAAGDSFLGEYQGTGRECFGKLSVLQKTIAWHTPFAACKRTPYTVIKQESGESGRGAVFLLRGRPCGFGVISLKLDARHPEYWNAAGYRSKEDYEKNSDDKLLCSVEKLAR